MDFLTDHSWFIQQQRDMARLAKAESDRELWRPPQQPIPQPQPENPEHEQE